MAKDIIEDVLGAIDIISQAKLNDMKFNKTDLCTIEKVVNKEKGEYLVSTGSLKYAAFAQDGATYREGNSVYVLIPNGDYNEEKLIVGRYSSSVSDVVETLSPLDVMMNMTGDIITNKNEMGLIANGEKQKIQISQDFDNTIYTGYDSLCISADFKTDIVATSGLYGLQLDIKYEEDESITSFVLDSSDMIGDPYSFNTYFNQIKGFVLDPEKSFTIEGLSFYQIKDSFRGFDNELLKAATQDNLFVKDIFVGLGLDIKGYTDDKVLLFAEGDQQTYSLDNTKAVLNMKWVHWTGSNAVVIKDLNDEAVKGLDVKVHWYRYNIGTKEKDPLLGEYYWDEVEVGNPFQYEINDLNKDWREERFKVWIECGAAIYKSDEIILSNVDGKHIDMTSGFIDGIYIKFPNNDRYRGNFYIYGEDLSADTLSYSRVLNKVFVDYRVNETAYDPWNDAEIIINWKIPFGDTMFIEPEDGKEYKSSNWIIQKEDKENKKEEIRGEDVIVLPKSKEGAAAIEFRGKTFEPLDGYYQILRTAKDKEQTYRIKKDYNNTFKSNTLICEVWRNGVLYNASQEFLFGVFGTNGTNYAFTIETEEYGDKDEEGKDIFLEKEPVAITPGITKKWKFIPHVADYEHKTTEIDLSNFGVEIFSHNAPSENEIKKYYTITDKELVVANNPLDNKYGIILKFTYKINDELTLSRYQPVAVRADKTYAYISGADRILYKSDGLNPKWNKDVYNIFDTNNNIYNINTTIWNIDNKEDKLGYYPQLLNKKLIIKDIIINENPQDIYEKYLDAPRMYMQNQKGEYPLITVYASDLDGKCQWLQPILVSTDPYGSTFLNTWDGKLKIDENNDTILAATIGAGIKNNDNTFSGAVMGELKSASNSSKNKTGILGFDHGVESFGFLTDGSAFIGKSGVGRISFDGTHGYIMSNNFNGFNGEDGTLPVYEDGSEKFDFKGAIPQGTYLGLSTGNSYFAGTIYSSAGQIADWSIKETILSSKDNNLFLSAEGYNLDDGDGLLVNEKKPTPIGENIGKWNIYSNGNFGVDTTGKLFAKDADISGRIEATSGTIGGCEIQNKVLKIKEANIDGKITANHIDASTLSIKSGQVTGSFSADKITAGTINDKDVKWQETVAITNYKVYQAKLEILGDDGAYHYAYVTLPYNLTAKKIYTLASVTS